jgi:hypothetical protein
MMDNFLHEREGNKASRRPPSPKGLEWTINVAEILLIAGTICHNMHISDKLSAVK